MRHFLILVLIIEALFLQSCDERITPSQIAPVEVQPPTKAEILTANAWQYNEVQIKGGSVTKVLFSRIASPPIGLTSDYAKATITYKTDGTAETDTKGIIEKAKWKFLNNESQIEITKADGVTKIIFSVETLTKDNFNQSTITTKASFNDDAFWLGYITNLGFPTNITEFTNVFKLIPYK